MRPAGAPAAPTWWWAAGGYVAGPVALAAWLTRRPLLLMEADSHLGVANRLAAPLARRVDAGLPAAGPRRAEVRRHRPAGEPGGGRGHAHRRAAGLRDPARAPPSSWWWAGSQGARTPEPGRRRGLRRRRRRWTCIHVAGPGQVDETRAAAGGPRRRRALPAGRLARQPARGHRGGRPGGVALGRLGVRAGRRSGGPRSWCPTPTPRPTTRPRTPAGSPRPAAAVVLPDAECTGERLRGLVGALLADRRRLEAHGRGGPRGGPPGRRRPRRRGGRCAPGPPPAARGRAGGVAAPVSGPAADPPRGDRRGGHERPGAAGRARPATAVSGTDREDSPTLAALRADGRRRPRRATRPAAAARPTPRPLVVSTAIDADNPELVEARRRGLPVLHRVGAARPS